MKYTRKEERERHICTWRVSGLSKAEYCRQKGLQRNSFYRWVREQGKTEQNADGFIEIAAQRFQPREWQQPTEGEIGIVLPNGYRMNIEKGFNPETFNAVLALLEAR